MLTVLKLGGELLEGADALRTAAQAVARLSSDGPLVVVHGGGRAIDADLEARGRTPRFADGLRVTDAAALDSVVAVLAGRTNTALVAALGVVSVRAVGLTGADGGLGLAERAPALTTARGERVDLGLVGVPRGTNMSLVTDLLAARWVPVIASVGVSNDGVLLNVNADTLAAHVAATLGAARLIVAGGTAGVLDANGVTIRALAPGAIGEMTASGAAHSGMVAKLAACRHALAAGVGDVRIVTGRGGDFARAAGTVIQREMVTT